MRRCFSAGARLAGPHDVGAGLCRQPVLDLAGWRGPELMVRRTAVVEIHLAADQVPRSRAGRRSKSRHERPATGASGALMHLAIDRAVDLHARAQGPRDTPGRDAPVDCAPPPRCRQQLRQRPSPSKQRMATCARLEQLEAPRVNRRGRLPAAAARRVVSRPSAPRGTLGPSTSVGPVCSREYKPAGSRRS